MFVVLHLNFPREEPAVMLVDFSPMFTLTVCVAVGEEVAVAAALEILHVSGLLLNLAGYFHQTVVTFSSERKAVLSDAE